MIVAFALPSQAATLREQAIVDLVIDEVMKRQQVPRRDVQVTWQDMSATTLVPALPEGQLTLYLAPGSHLGGKSTVPIQIMVDGRKFRTIFPRLDIKVFQQVLVAKAPIGRGSMVNQADVGLERTSTAGMAQAPLTRLEAVLGAEATREIRPGTVLTASMFRLPTIIKAGDMVNIIYTNGDLTIVYSGQARSAGAMGQLVRVMNMESKREFTARVTGPNRVEIKVED